MKAYIWESLSGLTDSYHDGGAALVIADSLDAAKFLLQQEAPHVNFFLGGLDHYGVFRENLNPNDPDHVLGLAGKQEELVLIFPDSGCC